jgi:hypothetical protein
MGSRSLLRNAALGCGSTRIAVSSNLKRFTNRMTTGDGRLKPAPRGLGGPAKADKIDVSDHERQWAG